MRGTTRRGDAARATLRMVCDGVGCVFEDVFVCVKVGEEELFVMVSD